MPYLLDANVFIAAKNLHYGLDFCPAFWDWLIAENGIGSVFSIEKVGDEVQALGDDLSDWAKNRGDGFFLRPDASLVPALGTLSQWATGQKYESAAVSTFLQVTDYYLVAQAKAGDHIVVTHEVPSASVRKIKIPDACIAGGPPGQRPSSDPVRGSASRPRLEAKGLVDRGRPGSTGVDAGDRLG